MKVMTIRKVPDEVYAELTAWAEQSHRSLQEQVLYLIEEEVKLRGRSVMESAEEYRTRLAGRSMGDIASEIREDRRR